jgi:hypothetical protein
MKFSEAFHKEGNPAPVFLFLVHLVQAKFFLVVDKRKFRGKEEIILPEEQSM